MDQQEITTRARKENEPWEWETHENLLSCAQKSFALIANGYSEFYVMIDGVEISAQDFLEKVKLELADKLN